MHSLFRMRQVAILLTEIKGIKCREKSSIYLLKVSVFTSHFPAFSLLVFAVPRPECILHVIPKQ